ncbi:MAG: glycosyltransferase [Clostridiales bacterium]|jgi:poly(glycerol-phosphate) alpha-glucosyltransferase|nr:glycosyltransferase [Clostridiales bacterium]
MDVFKNSETVIILENLGSGAVIENAMRKSNFYKDLAGYTPVLLTVQYNKYLHNIRGEFQNQKAKGYQTWLNEDARVFSVFDYFQRTWAYLRTLATDNAVVKKNDDILARINPGYKICYENGARVRYDYDNMRQLSRKTVYDSDNEEYHPAEYYYNTQGKICIKADYRWVTDGAFDTVYDILLRDQNVLEKYTLFDEEGNVSAELPGREALTAHCVDCLAEGFGKPVIMIDESAFFYGISGYIKNKKVAKSCVIHGTFLKDHNNPDSEPDLYRKYICENCGVFDAIVFQTETEVNDFADKYGALAKLYAIGHAYPLPVQKVPFEMRDTKKIIGMGRLGSNMKRFELTIVIFEYVAKQIDGAVLEIWGRGTEERVNELQGFIDKLGLTGRVVLKGYSENPREVFQGAVLNLNTSYHGESWNLVAMESICNGCPTITFDIKYGPPDVVRDGVTGFVFNEGDVEGYAEKVVYVLKNVPLMKRLSENCYADSERFSPKASVEKWRGFTEDMFRRAESG